ncbi:MAG TPA: UvrD-helicase domain-containing protein [Polyangiales bacterium]|nr:UvrD-helicase domain-containing protein [Polyangiales bacterium]
MTALADAAARSSIREDLDQSWVVEAAAGTGKTSELVQRIVRVILCGRGRLSSIASVTFTEKAAGEMKLRIRTELDRALFDPSLAQAARTRVRDALSELETAKVGTIHGFCAELLREHPVEAGVDPSFEVADGERQRRLLERVFQRWFERVLEDPPEGVRRIVRRRGVDNQGESPSQQLMAAAMALVETRDFDTPYRRDPFDRAAVIEELRAELHALAALATQGRGGDPLQRALEALQRKLEQAIDYDHDAYEEFLRQLLKDRDRDVWNDRDGRGQMYASKLPRADVVAARQRVRALLETAVRACEADLAACLSRDLAAVVRAYEEAKAEAGLLDFFDLLLCTRDLLSSNESTRRAIQAQLTHVFVDEFQDTDPVQSEILLLMCATDGAEADPWNVQLAPGKLFVVGDPKQSIYRFRRADVSLYERVKQQLLHSGARVLQLSTSFRSLPGIQATVNAAFEPVMHGDVSLGQAAYVALSAFRAERLGQPSVIALPAPQPYGKTRITKTAINASLPHAVGAWLEWLLRDSGYLVREHGEDVHVQARHVCLLFRRFRNYSGDLTRDYIRALEARRLPHVLSGGRSFHQREEVVAIRAALTAIEWPDDALHVYATLRGPFVAINDETLFTFKSKLGHLHPFGPVTDVARLEPEELEVLEALQLLARLHRGRNRRPIADTLSDFLSTLRAHAGVAIWPTGEQALGNVLRVLDFARAYERKPDASSFRGFVEWLEEQAESQANPETGVIEQSSEGIRLMTVHAAKGLEFPVVVLCDPTAPKRSEYASRYIDPARKLWAQSLCDAQPIELFERREEVREHDAAEIVRLAYVAATRAQDLLVVPVCGDGPIEGWLDVLAPALYPPQERCRSPEQPTFRVPEFGEDSVSNRADHIPEHSVMPGEHRPMSGDHRVVWWDPNLLELKKPSAGGVAQHDLLRADELTRRDAAGLGAYQSFCERRNAVLASASQPSARSRAMTVVAMEREHPLQAPEVIDLGLPRAGRPSGPRFGTLVHALFANLSFGAVDEAADLERLARALARGLDATQEECERAAGDVRAALAHPFFERVRAAAVRGDLHREAPITAKAPDGELLDGVVDLLLIESDPAGRRLLLADFKTDAELGDGSHYAAQLALYANALERATTLPVQSCLVRV